ncbi:TetR/AcrR family transcriptional regulator [Ornithinibacillus gellani]|uniref:TetR/AcrR family transcriptional regulator n=1 Tax=Ornithinibacillus gellani TaxID=2293253 RepID=UPI000F4763BB|nr:TetR/AcrR family transcriptional regulator [Ornithinibacillus gellani]TQS75906.1 TetR/AcrR family transcriptional regulator [Ornithinibacillus gellani]
MQHSHRPLGRPRKEQNGISTKDMILQIATGLFLEKGYPLVSMDDVAKHSNVTKATVYYYYKTKADLFTDAMVALMIRISEKIVGILSTEEPLKDQLFEVANAHLQATVDFNINSFMKEAKTSLSNEQLQLMKEAEDHMYSVLENALEKAMIKGEIPASNPRLGALLFVSMLTVGNGLEKEFKDTFASFHDMVTQFIDLYWNGLANKD